VFRNVGGDTRCPDIAHFLKLHECRACLRYSILSIEGAERVIVRSIQAWCLKPMTHTSNMHCVIQLEYKHGVMYIINGLRLFFNSY
jgi:hypothetical protein